MTQFNRTEQFEILSDLTAMLTLALDEGAEGVDWFIAETPQELPRLNFLLRSSMVLYADALRRLGREQGFDPREVMRRVALDEARERWGVIA